MKEYLLNSLTCLQRIGFQDPSTRGVEEVYLGLVYAIPELTSQLSYIDFYTFRPWVFNLVLVPIIVIGLLWWWTHRGKNCNATIARVKKLSLILLMLAIALLAVFIYKSGDGLVNSKFFIFISDVIQLFILHIIHTLISVEIYEWFIVNNIGIPLFFAAFLAILLGGFPAVMVAAFSIDYLFYLFEGGKYSYIEHLLKKYYTKKG